MLVNGDHVVDDVIALAWAFEIALTPQQLLQIDEQRSAASSTRRRRSSSTKNNTGGDDTDGDGDDDEEDDVLDDEAMQNLFSVSKKLRSAAKMYVHLMILRRANLSFAATNGRAGTDRVRDDASQQQRC